MEEADKKKFELPDIVILLLLAVPDDIIQVVADFAIAIPAIGMVIAGLAKVFHLAVWGVIFLWLTMKFGFGSAAMLQIGGGIADFFGIPAQTISIVAAIVLVNYGEAITKAFSAIPGVDKLATAALAVAEGDKMGAVKAIAGKTPSPLNASGQRVVSTPEFARARAQSSTLVAQSASEEAPAQEGEIPESAFGMPPEPFEVIHDENFKLAA